MNDDDASPIDSSMSVSTDISTAVGVGAFLGAGLLGRDGIVARRGRDRRATIRCLASGPPASWMPGTLPAALGAISGTSGPKGSMNRTARWARAADLRPLVVGKVAGASSPPPGRLVLGTAGRHLIATERAQSVIVIGPTQSRKTSGFAVPAIMGWEGPVMAASVKSDLLEHTVDHRSLAGAVWCFDPSGSTGCGLGILVTAAVPHGHGRGPAEPPRH